MHRHQWIIFLPNFILSRFYVALYLLSCCLFHFNWCRVYIYTYIFTCICIYIYIYVYECMLLCIHDYMYVFYVCSFYVCWFYDVLCPWLLGQRWPNEEVQTNKQTYLSTLTNSVFFVIYELCWAWIFRWLDLLFIKSPDYWQIVLLYVCIVTWNAVLSHLWKLLQIVLMRRNYWTCTT